MGTLRFLTAVFLAWTGRAEELRFNRDIRPILSDHCYACHGPDAHSREADLRLDRRESALGTTESGAAIVPGKPELSELVQRINTDDPDDLMPPPKHHKPLSTAEKAVLVRWIADGAEYERHWAFEPPRRTAPGIANPIDHFVRARLKPAALSSAPAASRETLIRRVTLDLTGLPPTPAEIDAFVSDTGADAYQQLVDRLMASTAYAERRAQDWLDLARYADTRGFADDKQRAIWPWRDWVIRAMDHNMPFDQFTIEQLAGDMLPGATHEQRLATGFQRNAPQARGMTYPVEEYRLMGVKDRVNTIGRVWLGLTMDCAECHDHKFDPITQRDYYAMFAIFNNTEHSGSGHGQGGPTMSYRLPSADGTAEMAAERKRLEAAVADARKDLPMPRRLPEAQVIGAWDGPALETDPAQFAITGDLTIAATIRTTQPVADILSKYDWRGKQRSYLFGIGGEGDTNSIPGHLFFWVSSQTASFSGVTVYSSRPVNDGQEHQVAVEFVAGKSLRLFIDGIEDKAARSTGAVPASIAKSDRPLAIGSGYSSSRTANAFRFADGLSGVQLSDQALGDTLLIGAGDRLKNLLAALDRLEQRGSPKNATKVPVMSERAVPRETYIHVRGDFLNRGEPVGPGAPSLFKLPTSRQIHNRLDLARWLVGSRNPLTARVVVNRFWQRYFGHGLVRTPDDFGAQGTPPTHPDLLDWLATEFVDSGWDMKHMHRLIVSSATYQQSARIPTDILARDPDNLLLAHMPRVRLPAEQIRDQALAVSGLLVRTAGGPPVFPVQPDGYWQRRILPGKWSNSVGDAAHRRTMYSYWRRMALHPSLEILNAPARENCVVRREMSNVPTQALVLLNDPIFHEAATAFAARLIREQETDDARLERAFRLVLGRRPAPAERARFLAYLARQSDADPAVWTRACSVLLNLDETLTRP